MGCQVCFPLVLALTGFSVAQGQAQPAAPGPPPPAPNGAYVRPMAALPPLATFQARIRERFMEMDTSHSGRISLQDWMAWHAAHPGRGGDPARQFQMIDRNHDGFITPDEIDAHSAEVYARRSARQPVAPSGYSQGPAPQGPAPQGYNRTPGPAGQQDYPEGPQ